MVGGSLVPMQTSVAFFSTTKVVHVFKGRAAAVVTLVEAPVTKSLAKKILPVPPSDRRIVLPEVDWSTSVCAVVSMKTSTENLNR